MLQQIDDVSVMEPEGELNGQEAEVVLAKIGELIRRQDIKIVLDLRDVEHIHFRFLGDLLPLARASSCLSGGIKLANVSPYADKILKIAGVDRFFETYESVADAVLSFENSFETPCLLN